MKNLILVATFIALIAYSTQYDLNSIVTPPVPLAYNGEEIFDVVTVENKQRHANMCHLVFHASKVDWNNTEEIKLFNSSAVYHLGLLIQDLATLAVEVIPIVYGTPAYSAWTQENQLVISVLLQLSSRINQTVFDFTHSAVDYKTKVKAGLEIYRMTVRATVSLLQLYMNQEQVFVPNYVFKVMNNSQLLPVSLEVVTSQYTYQYMNQYVRSYAHQVTPQDLARLFILISGAYSKEESLKSLRELEDVLPPMRYKAFLNAFRVTSAY